MCVFRVVYCDNRIDFQGATASLTRRFNLILIRTVIEEFQCHTVIYFMDSLGSSTLMRPSIKHCGDDETNLELFIFFSTSWVIASVINDRLSFDGIEMIGAD